MASRSDNLPRGRKSRNDRLVRNHAGSWGTSSVDILVLLKRIYLLSKKDAEDLDGNCSRWTYCGIPLTLSALRCLIVEYASWGPADEKLLEILTENDDLRRILLHLKAPQPLIEETEYLIEIRNEIIHPVHRPSGTRDNWPDYLLPLKEKGLLQTTGNTDGDYILLDQIASHRLFSWACEVARDVALFIMKSNAQKWSHFCKFADTWCKLTDVR